MKRTHKVGKDDNGIVDLKESTFFLLVQTIFFIYNNFKNIEHSTLNDL